MEQCQELEAVIARNLEMRGLMRIPGRLAFRHAGEIVELCVEPSVYTGLFIIVLEGRRKLRHFRAHAGAYDWNAIGAYIVETAERRRRTVSGAPAPASVEQQNERLARDLASIVNAGDPSQLAIEPSQRAPGRVRVRMPEIELDPVSVMRLFEVVRDALPQATPRGAPNDPLPVL